MEDCIFCKIVAGDIPSRRVYEDDTHIAFLAVPPRTRGHVLVVPREHYRWVWDDPNVGHAMEVAQKIVHAQQKAFDTEWVVSVIFGEEIPHAHIWLVPRHEGDGHGGSLNPELTKDLSDEEMDEAAEKIRAALS